jgi:hypothetical protein
VSGPRIQHIDGKYVVEKHVSSVRRALHHRRPGLLHGEFVAAVDAPESFEEWARKQDWSVLANNSLVCITSELPVIRAQSDGIPPLAVRRFGRIVLSQCAAARVLLDKRRHKYERQ